MRTCTQDVLRKYIATYIALHACFNYFGSNIIGVPQTSTNWFNTQGPAIITINNVLHLNIYFIFLYMQAEQVQTPPFTIAVFGIFKQSTWNHPLHSLHCFIFPLVYIFVYRCSKGCGQRLFVQLHFCLIMS